MRAAEANLGGRQFYNNEEMTVVSRESLRMHGPGLYRDGVFQLVSRWDKCVGVLWGYCKI